jgi:hypothetical protein
MLGDLVLVGGVVGFVVGLLEVSHRLEEAAPGPLGTAAAVREAMRGAEGNAVRAEYRSSGIEPVRHRPRPLGFGL